MVVFAEVHGEQQIQKKFRTLVEHRVNFCGGGLVFEFFATPRGTLFYIYFSRVGHLLKIFNLE